MAKTYEESADARIGQDIDSEIHPLMPREFMPIGADASCKTCNFWWGFADSGWCYCAELFVNGDDRCLDWVLRGSNFMSFHDRLVTAHGVIDEEEETGKESASID